MAKKKTSRALHIPDFFGTNNTYKVFALQSELSAFPFANQLGQAENIAFTILPDLEYTSNKFSAGFTVFYAAYSQTESIHCLLLENKTKNFNQGEIFVSKAEKKLPFQTLSLFEELLYLFNNQGLRCFDLEVANMDYLLLLFAKKEIENEIFLQFFKNLMPFHAKDISFLLEREQTAAQTKIVSFLRDFYCKYEVKATQFSQKRKMDLLSPIKQIPRQNLQYPIPILLENSAINTNLQISEECLALLVEDI